MKRGCGSVGGVVFSCPLTMLRGSLQFLLIYMPIVQGKDTTTQVEKKKQQLFQCAKLNELCCVYIYTIIYTHTRMILFVCI